MKKENKAKSFEPELNKKRKIELLPLKNFRLTDVCFVIYDMVAVTLAYFFALWFRFDCRFSEIEPNYFMAWLKFVPIYAVISVLVLWLFHLYQSLWKYASFAEMSRIVCASGLLSVIHAVMITTIFSRMPISYYFIGAADRKSVV